jgi:hypothetical protein
LHALIPLITAFELRALCTVLVRTVHAVLCGFGGSVQRLLAAIPCLGLRGEAGAQLLLLLCSALLRNGHDSFNGIPVSLSLQE